MLYGEAGWDFQNIESHFGRNIFTIGRLINEYSSPSFIFIFLCDTKAPLPDFLICQYEIYYLFSSSRPPV
jgi:hypothetical protein